MEILPFALSGHGGGDFPHRSTQTLYSSNDVARRNVVPHLVVEQALEGVIGYIQALSATVIIPQCERLEVLARRQKIFEGLFRRDVLEPIFACGVILVYSLRDLA